MLAKKYNAKDAEKKWQDFWQVEGIYKFNKEADQVVYSVDTPPPTVNGKIHIGHIFSYSQAEIMARYKRMKGFNVFYPFGFDDNGLPTERLVEKNHKMKAHETTREHFTELCLEETERLEKQFKELFLATGFSCDWDYEYSTISSKSQKTSQKSFLDLYRKKKVYYSNAPAIWCTECQTAIAQAELETKEIPSVFHYLRFYLDGNATDKREVNKDRLKGSNAERYEIENMEEGILLYDTNSDLSREQNSSFIEIATTRPELLAACQCIFIHPDDKKNQWLCGKQVRVPLFGFSVPVLTDEQVDMEKGSGMVMCCTFGDLTDLEWYKQHKLTFKEAILPNGTMSEICEKYAGLSVVEARKQMVEDLLLNGFVIKQENLRHMVATHERCGSPMEITVKKQWFIDIFSKKLKFIDAGNRIHWYPEHMKLRYLNWVENLEWDWCISRQRYFGVPFPVWYCADCGETRVAGEDEMPVNPLTTTPKEACQCGCNVFLPEQDIMDTWATSSVTPMIHANWQDDDEFQADMLPMSVRPNAHDIIRTWDFYTIVKSLYHFDKLPWENVMISGHVMASQAEKISKRKDNSNMEPQKVLDTYSADATRMWAATGSLGNDIIFSEEEFKNSLKLINKLWNASKFVIMHLEGFEKETEEGVKIQLNPYQPRNISQLLPMDEWAINKYNQMHYRYETYLEKYEIGLAVNELTKFFWNFCDNYIEIVKNRLYKPEIYGEDARKSAQEGCYKVLLRLLKCYAIYIPHITEEIYKGYFEGMEGIKSIHLTHFESLDADQRLEMREHGYGAAKTKTNIGDQAIEVISQIRRYKSAHNLSLKEEIAKVIIYASDIEAIKQAEMDIKATCSVLEIIYMERDESMKRDESILVKIRG